MGKLLLFTIFIFVFSSTSADSFRCGRTIVKGGESSTALTKKCGQPIRKFSSKETITENGRRSRVSVSNWVYERSGKKDMIVSVHSGTVIKIKVD